MQPISEEEEEEDSPSSSFCSCLFGSSSAKQNASSDRSIPHTHNGGTALNDAEDKKSTTAGSLRRSARPGMDLKYMSVYMSARDTLGESELAALKEFEEAVMEHLGGDESVYFDALDASDETSSAPLVYAPAAVADPCPRGSVISMDDPSSLLKVMEELKEPRVKLDLAGYPGLLTKQELAACQRFRTELKERKKDVANDGRTYEEIVHVFLPVETEPYALCRFLRARQFDVDKVFEMISGGVDIWREARKHDFFPDPNVALGAPLNVFLTQFPIVQAGCAKNGASISYVRAADLNVEGMECLLDLDRITNYAWHSNCHKFKEEVAKAQEKNSDIVRCESLQVIDLKGLSASTLNKNTLEALQKTIQVNQCFPEVLNCMVILNSPRFFSFFWRVIKSMLDPRTTSKITMFSNEKDGHEWLLQRVDKSELLTDYGGSGLSFDQLLNNQSAGAKRQVVKLFSIHNRSQEGLDFSLSDEKINWTVYTRSALGADFVLSKDGQKVGTAEVKSSESTGTSQPYSIAIFPDLKGPGNFHITPQAKSGVIEHFLVAGLVT